jgi:hypothetical protein
MLQLLIHITIISIICIIWGLPSFFLTRKIDEEKYWFNTGANLISLLFFSGLLTIAFLSSLLILFLPLKFFYLFIPTVLLAILLRIRYHKELRELFTTFRQTKRIKTAWKIFTFSGLFLLLIMGTLKPVNPDTQLYHLQLIRWTNEYGVVPGMANIYPRLGLGSNWFNLISFFDIPLSPTQNFTYLNTTCTIWFLLWLTGKWHYYTVSNDNIHSRVLSLFYALITTYSIFEWQLLRDTANSTAYDFIVTALIIFCLSYFIEKKLYDESDKSYSNYFLFFSFSVITIKLSGIFFLLFTIIAILLQNRLKLLLRSILFFLVIFIPVLIKNYISTGYLLFPSGITTASPDWQMPGELVKQFKDYILNVNRYYNSQIGFINSVDKSTLSWIPYWFKGILLQHKILIFFTFILPVLSFIIPIKSFNTKKLRLFFTGIWIMLVFWFFTAPDPRFAFGTILISAFLPLALLFNNPATKKYSGIIVLFLSIGIFIYSYSKLEYLINKPSCFLYPAPNDSPPCTAYKIGNITFKQPVLINGNWNNRCFYTPLPCISEKNPYLEPRGKKIKNGFIMKNPDSNFLQQYNY